MEHIDVSEGIHLNLKEQIERAFANSSYPGDDHLVSHECPECDEFANKLKGKHWREIDPAMVFRDESQILLLTSEAYLFYLPAYMIEYLSNPDVGNWTIDLLTPPPHNYLSWTMDEFLDRYRPLTGPQAKVIGSLVQFLLNVYPLDFDGTASVLTDFWVKGGYARYGIGSAREAADNRIEFP